MKNTHGGVLLLVKLHAKDCNFTKSNTSPWVSFTFFKLYKCYQIVQNISHIWTLFVPLQSTKILWNSAHLTICQFRIFLRIASLVSFPDLLHYIRKLQILASDTSGLFGQKRFKMTQNDVFAVLIKLFSLNFAYWCTKFPHVLESYLRRIFAQKGLNQSNCKIVFVAIPPEFNEGVIFFCLALRKHESKTPFWNGCSPVLVSPNQIAR